MVYALHVSASFFGEVVQETFARRGDELQLGNSEALAVPVPEGQPYLARLSWSGPQTVDALDGLGNRHVISPETPLSLNYGTSALTLSLVKQGGISRREPMNWQMNLGWLVMVLAMTILGQQSSLAWELRCDSFAALSTRFPNWSASIQPKLAADPLFRACFASGDDQSMTAIYTAEYLTRLLQKDYAGEEVGHLGEEREQHDQATDSFFMPAGDIALPTELGGSAVVTEEEVRATEEQDAAETREEEEGSAPLAIDDGDESHFEESEKDGVADADEIKEEAADAAPPPSETKEGFGLKDWYNADDKAMEEFEIEVMIKSARRTLRIDPNSLYALSLLSYYQYLGEDYDGAIDTYDKMIAIDPEDPASYNNKALVYKRRGQYKQEEALYRVALALDPLDDTAMNNLAVSLSHQGRFEESLTIMKQLAVMVPSDPYTHLHRSKIHSQMGDTERAYHYLDAALSGASKLDTLHHIEFRQDIRVDPSFETIRDTPRFDAIMTKYYGRDTPIP